MKDDVRAFLEMLFILGQCDVADLREKYIHATSDIRAELKVNNLNALTLQMMDLTANAYVFVAMLPEDARDAAVDLLKDTLDEKFEIIRKQAAIVGPVMKDETITEAERQVQLQELVRQFNGEDE